jgi:GAF domain-containing protein
MIKPSLAYPEEYCNERILEDEMRKLTCLFNISREMQEDISIEEVCRRIIRHLAAAMSYSEVAVPVIELNGFRFPLEAHFKPSSHSLHAPVARAGVKYGDLWVYFRKALPINLPAEQNFIGSIAESLSRWIERRQGEEKLRAIHSFSQQIVLSGDIPTISSIVFDCAVKVLRMEDCQLLLIDKGDKTISCVASMGGGCGEEVQYPLDSEKGIIAWVARKGESLVVPDVSKDRRYLPGLKDSRSEIAVPMKLRNRVIGVLDAESTKINAFNERDVALFSILANSAAIAIDNMRLNSELKEYSQMLKTKVDEKAWKIETLLKTSYSLRQTMSWERGLDTIVNGIVAGLKIDASALFLVNERTQTLDFARGAGETMEAEHLKLPLNDTSLVAIKCIKEKRPINIHDASCDPDVKIQVGRNLSSFAWLPVMSQREVIGAICIANHEGKVPIDDDDIKILTLYMNITALFLESQRYLVVPAIENNLKTEIKYPLQPLACYLVLEEKADRVFDVFYDQISHGIPGFCVTRLPLEKIKEKYGLEKTPVLSLSHMAAKDNVDPTDMGKLVHIISEFLNMAEGGCVLLDGLEYLITENDFLKVAKFLHSLVDAITTYRGSLLLSMNPDAFSTIELSIVKREFTILAP